LCLRGFDDARAYLHLPDGEYNNDSGTGNTSNPGDPNIRQLIMTALERFAALGIDGFRFDLASLLTRDGGVLVEQITEWGVGRDVRLIAEPWDLAEYQLGKWAAPWLQWNDRFRDDMRGFVRGEPGKVQLVTQRVQGSPDLLAKAGGGTVNFISAHDGLTMHDLTLVTSDRHHSWNVGPALRMQQMKNYFTVLLLSSGPAMFVMGDEFARTQQGLDNPFDVDGPVSWVDWTRLVEWKELHDYVKTLLGVRRGHPPVEFHFYGAVQEKPDIGWESRSIAWSAGGLYVMANAWWQPLQFEVREPGPWEVALATSPSSATLTGSSITVAARSMVVLRRP
jgi:isoamylase